MEIWKACKEFPQYEVSSEGRIRNIKTGRLLKIQAEGRRYSQVCIRENKTQYTRNIHRLIADSFYDGDHDGLDVNHIDGNKHNNNITNLEWCSRKENVQHAIQTGLRQEPRRTKVRVVETGEIFESVLECSKVLKCDRAQIHRCLTGKEKSCKGYHFEIV